MKIKQMDNVFPTFSKVFDPSYVVEEINKFWIKDEKTRIIYCDIADVKYEPGVQCTLLYRLKLKKNKIKQEQLFVGVLLKEDSINTEIPSHAIHSEKLNMLLIPFPHDPQMDWLPQANNQSLVLEKLKRNIDQDDWKIQSVDTTLLAYVPLMRATFSYEIQTKNTLTNALRTDQWIAKTNSFKHPEIVFANYWTIWKAAQGKILMPKPTGFMLNPRLTFQEKIEGTRLGALVDSPDFGEMMKKTAQSIGQFHNLQVSLLNVRGLKQEARTFNRWSNVLMHLSPHISEKIEQLKRKILSEIENRICVEAPIHADFHHTNILVDGVTVQLIDMDEVAFGDPCVDIGRFLSSLRIPSLRCFGDFDGLKAQREAFLETYLEYTSRSVRDIRLFEASSLFTSAASTFRLQRPNWENELVMLLEESENTFSQAMQGTPKSIRAPQTTGSFDEIPDWIQDVIYVKALLAPVCLEKYDLELIKCQIKSIIDNDIYHRVAYCTILWDGENIKEKQFEVALPKNIQGVKNLKFLQKINTATNRSKCSLFPKIIKEYPALGAFIVESLSGQHLGKVLHTDQGPEVVGLIGAELLHFHNSFAPSENGRIPLLMYQASPEHMIISNGIHRQFPLEKKYGTPQQDVEYFLSLIESHCAQNGKKEYSKILMDQFKMSYEQPSQKSYESKH